MKKNRYPKSLCDVWKWKEKLMKKTAKMKDVFTFYEDDAAEIIKKLGLKKVSDLNFGDNS
ncbi:MAG: hypothetical protein PHW04_09590 [Candidatus Wallbacteria bacterium]|nr:hypothetical protein [Candidatus Wallbacteria bacterium]